MHKDVAKKSEQSSKKTLSNQCQFVTIKDAAAVVSYTPDYIARLAHEGKIIAEWRGREWVISVDSLKQFSLEQAAKQRARQRALREERIREYAARQQATRTAAAIASDRQAVALSAVVAGVVGVCVLLVAMVGWTAHQAELQLAELWGGAQTVWHQVSDIVPSEMLQVAATAATYDELTQATYAPQQVEITETGTLLIHDNVTVDEVVSDPVVVTAISTSSFHITPVFGNSTESYVVELVPRGRVVDNATATVMSI